METDLLSDNSPEEISLLLVDDNYALLDVLREHLELWGYRPVSTSSGSEAQKLLREWSFHVVLADLRMSPVSGWEVIQRAKEREGTEVIVMTGYADLDSTLEALHHRVFDFIEKPIDFDRLKRAVRNAGQQSLLTRENRRVFEELESKTRHLEGEVQEARAQLEDMATRDGSTGLRNQRSFLELLEREVERSLRYHHPLTLALLRPDSFSTLVEKKGKMQADVVRRRVASLLRSSARGTDYACLYGEDAFAIIFPETTGEQAHVVVRRLCELLKEEAIPVDENQTLLAFAVGLATCPRDADTCDESIARAENALHEVRKKR